MAVIFEKAFQAFVYALLFMTLSYTLYALTPLESVGIAELHEAYVFVLRIFALGFLLIAVLLMMIGGLSRLGITDEVACYLSSHHVIVGYVINGFGLLGAFYFLSEFVVF